MGGFAYFCLVGKRKKNIQLQNVLVQDYAAEGKSLAKINGKVIFIEQTVPGDVVNIQLTKNKKDWAEAFPLNFVEYSKQRIEPFCKHFGVCGGCQWQMLPYNQQLFYKQKQVLDSLNRIAKVQLPPAFAMIGATETKFYRNKLEYTFSNKRFIPFDEFKKLQQQQIPSSSEKAGSEAGFFAGYHAKGIFDKIVEIDTCYLQPEPTNLLRKAIVNIAVKNNFSFYDIKNHTGFLRNVVVRMATTGEWFANVIVGEDDEQKIKILMDEILKQFPAITTLLYTVNKKWNDSINDLQPETYYGKGFIVEKLEDFQFKISPKSFFQTNTKQAEKLYSVARNFAELNGTQTLYDLYCGTGSIGIFASRLAKKIIGVEVIADAIDDAKQNALLNKIEHAEFFAGDVIDVCNDEFFLQHGKPDIIITDPPRAGMHGGLIKKMLQIAAPIVVYVSCNPATQARDLALLDEKYSVTKIQPVDMFPHTHHIENIVQLKLKY